jgi:hypothetical protein
VTQPDEMQHVLGCYLLCCAVTPAMHLQPHEHVLAGGKALMQIMGLEDEAETTAERLLPAAGAPRSSSPRSRTEPA